MVSGILSASAHMRSYLHTTPLSSCCVVHCLGSLNRITQSPLSFGWCQDEIDNLDPDLGYNDQSRGSMQNKMSVDLDGTEPSAITNLNGDDTHRKGVAHSLVVGPVLCQRVRPSPSPGTPHRATHAFPLSSSGRRRSRHGLRLCRCSSRYTSIELASNTSQVCCKSWRGNLHVGN